MEFNHNAIEIYSTDIHDDLMIYRYLRNPNFCIKNPKHLIKITNIENNKFIWLGCIENISSRQELLEQLLPKILINFKEISTELLGYELESPLNYSSDIFQIQFN